MTWIRTRPPTPEDPDAAAAWHEAVNGYPPEYSGRSEGPGRLPEAVLADSIVQAHSLIPEVMKHTLQGFRALLDPALPLSRREHELIAATVSAQNQCFY